MGSLPKNFFVSLRIALAMFAAMIAVEAVGLLYYDITFQYSQMLLALAIALAVAGSIAAAVAGGCRLVRQFEPVRNRLTIFLTALAIIYLLLVLWLKDFFVSNPWWMYGLGLAAGLFLVMVLGRLAWVYLNRSESALTDAWFMTLAPVTAVGAGLYSVADHYLAEPGPQKALAMLLILIAIVVSQYLGIRLIYARRQKKFTARAHRVHWIIIAIVPLLALTGHAIQHHRADRPATATPDSPPVILLSIDTLRADRIGCYNPDVPTTPGFDNFARDAIKFQHTVSPSSWTPSAVGSFFTGLYPSACNAGTIISDGGFYNYSGPLFAAKSLTEAFQEAGYNTAVFTHNPWIMPSHGYDGIDHFELGNDPKNWPRFRLVMGLEFVMTPFRRHFGLARNLNLQALRWLEHRPAGPFFMWVHYVDPHLPYKPHQEHPARAKGGPMSGALASDGQSWRIRAGTYNLSDNDRKFLSELYDGEVRYNDDELAWLLARIKELGLYDNSVIMLTSDHGEELWDHGDFEHGHAFYNEIIRVPLLIKLPGQKLAGTEVTPWVSTLWLGQTLLAAANLKVAFPGQSLLDCLDDPTCGADDGLDGRVWLSERTLYKTDPGALTTREGIKAYFHSTGAVSCFDLNRDPGEQSPFPEADCPWPADLGPPRELFAKIQADNRKIYDSLGGDNEAVQRATPEEVRRLRALGYIK